MPLITSLLLFAAKGFGFFYLFVLFLFTRVPYNCKHRKQMMQSFPTDGWAPSLATKDTLAKEHLLPLGES
jgi:hypothetical protein